MEILSVTDSFATKYYTWRFKDAARFSDEEFTRFLRFLSSNVNQKDIDVLTKSAETPGFSVDNINIKETDLADVTLKLTNIYQMDSIGKEPELTTKTTHKLILKKNNGKWQVSKVISKNLSNSPCLLYEMLGGRTDLQRNHNGITTDLPRKH